MNPWFGRGLFLVLFVATIAIRHPHEVRSRQTKVVEDRKGPREIVLLALVFLGHMVLPILSVTPLLAFADYPLHPVAFGAGALLVLLTLWLFHRAHRDLGTNWSMSLSLREEHRLITNGIYARIRHPMYAALFADALAQALLLPNFVAGPAFLVAFTLMFLLRFRAEERMMLDKFGAEYEAYRSRTKRLVPGIW